jgi:GLPGLI family protein
MGAGISCMKIIAMHILSFLPCLFFATLVQAQPKVLNHAVITMKTSFSMPEDASNVSEGEGNQMRNMINMMGDDNKTVIYYKDDKAKIVSDMGMGKSTVIMDRKAKRTTTLMEMMGNKTGFFSTEEDEVKMKKRMDSMQNSRKNAVTSIDVVNLGGGKKIAGFNCKQALIKTHHQNGTTDSMRVWYTPDVKMAANFAYRGGGGMMMMGGGGGMAGFEKLEGFPMEYEMKMPRGGVTIHMEVTKIEPDKNIDDKEFDIPKGFDIKPMSEMMGGRGMFRFGGQ